MEETKLIIDRLVREIADTYKQLLIQNKKVASGNLINSIQSDFRATSDGYEGNIIAADYAKYVEDGRAPGKFPPPPAIQNWVRFKFPTSPPIQQKQIAFLIGRKIAKFGIPAGNYLQKAIEMVYPKYEYQIDLAIKKDLQWI